MERKIYFERERERWREKRAVLVIHFWVGRGNRVVRTAMVSLQVRSKHWLPCVRLASLLFQCHVIASTRTRRTQLTISLFNPFTELLGLNLHSPMRQVCLILYIILSLFSYSIIHLFLSIYLFFKTNTSIPRVELASATGHSKPPHINKKTGFDLTSNPPLSLSLSCILFYFFIFHI